MKIRNLSLISTLGVSLFLTISCRPHTPIPETPEQQKDFIVKHLTVDASDYTKWVYVNLAEAKIVEIETPETDLGWDIALHRYDFKTNGGTSGRGKGAAYETSQTSLVDKSPAVPEDQWVVDREGLLLMMFGGMGGKREYKKQSANFLLSSEPKGDGQIGYLNKGIIWSEGMPPRVSINPHVYLVRSAKGEVVRLRVLDYRNEKNDRGHIKFEYALAKH